MPIKLDPKNPTDAVLLEKYPTGSMPTRREALREREEQQRQWETSPQGRSAKAEQVARDARKLREAANAKSLEAEAKKHFLRRAFEEWFAGFVLWRAAFFILLLFVIVPISLFTGGFAALLSALWDYVLHIVMLPVRLFRFVSGLLG